MIITRSPLRVSIGGGEPISPPITRTMAASWSPWRSQACLYFSPETFRLWHAPSLLEIERVASRDEIRHPIIRECLNVTRTEATTSRSPAWPTCRRMGLGSSGSFTTALLKALHIYHRRYIDMGGLAELACHIEIDLLKEPIGKQDQYIAAFGGLTAFTFNCDGSVDVETLEITDDTYEDLDENLMMFFSGRTRNASAILKEQDAKSKSSDRSMISNLIVSRSWAIARAKRSSREICASGARLCSNIGKRRKSVRAACRTQKLTNIMTCHAQWCDWRQAGRRGRGRLPAVFMPKTRAVCGRP